ncbi:MAG: NAD(P)-dependent oxidoreductase [Nitrospira sp.]|nr:NAD(P)-dependent oxidoreductase [Nitrospira sp.]
MSRILVTGGSGLIGRSLLARLSGHAELVAVGRHHPEVSDVQWIAHDLSESTLPMLPKDVSDVIYLAQSEHFREFPEQARDIFEVNVANVQRMLDWARGSGVTRFILASSGGVYGHGENSFREDDIMGPGGPLGFYLASKQCSELVAAGYSECFAVVILRFFFVFGPGQKKSMLIPRLIDSVAQGKPVSLQGQEGIRLNPIFVDDAALAVSRALELTGSHIINVAGPEVMHMRDIASKIGKAVGRDPVFHVDHGASPRHLSGDITKMCRLLAAPAVHFSDGLARMLQGSRGDSSSASKG